MGKEKTSKEKAVFTCLIICIVALLIGILGILFMPNIKEWFHPYPQSRTFNENDSNITINKDDDFTIQFKSNGEKIGQGWNLLSSELGTGLLSVLEGNYGKDYQTWRFYGQFKGETILSFQKDDQTKTFKVRVK